MKHENEPDGMAVCNFCDQSYDPEETHTCKGNQILGRKYKPRRVVEEEGRPADHFYEPFNVATAREVLERMASDHGQGIADSIDNGILDDLRKQSALSTQPGGDHYRKHAIQPVEYIDANDLDFFQGNIVKYATRHKDKGGAEDIRKIIHYAQIILELQYKETK